MLMVRCKGLKNRVHGVLAAETITEIFFFFPVCVRIQEDKLPPGVSRKTGFRRSTAAYKASYRRLFSLRARSRVSVTRYGPLPGTAAYYAIRSHL